MQSLSSGEITDRKAIISAANSGDYVAQYVISLKDGGDARKFNGERTALLKEKALLLLLSAIKGNYQKSKDELKEVAKLEMQDAITSITKDKIILGEKIKTQPIEQIQKAKKYLATHCPMSNINLDLFMEKVQTTLASLQQLYTLK